MSSFDDALRQAREAEQLRQQAAVNESHRMAANVAQFAALMRNHGVPTTPLKKWVEVSRDRWDWIDDGECWLIEPGQFAANAATPNGEWIQVWYDCGDREPTGRWRRNSYGPGLTDEVLAQAAMRLLGEL